MFLTLPIRDVLPATARARLVRLNLDGARFPYLAGQAVMVATHGRTPRRPYSMAASPAEAERDGWIELLVGVEDDGQPGPHWLLEPGTPVDVEGPVGTFTFPPEPDERRFVFIAGGTGIAPLRAMLHHALAIPHAQIGLLYSARSAGDFAYEPELRAMARAGQIELRQTVTREISTDWDGPRGRIGRAELAPLVHNPATLCFICGPPALVEEIPKLLRDLGVPRERIRLEQW